MGPQQEYDVKARSALVRIKNASSPEVLGTLMGGLERLHVDAVRGGLNVGKYYLKALKIERDYKAKLREDRK